MSAQAFGNQPDAINLWIGDDRSISSTHRDPYDNIYWVVRGEKHFTLLPPSDVVFLPERPFRVGRHRWDKAQGKWVVDLELEEPAQPVPSQPAQRQSAVVNWVDHDARFAGPDIGENITPINVVVRAGEVLYIPALW